MATDSLESKLRRRATLSDIARRAGVTVGTVSGVLGGKAKERRISDEVAARIRKVALEVDYAPNLLVHSLRHGSTKILSFFNGFRHSHDRSNYYMSAMTAAVQHAGGQLGYNILIYCDFKLDAEATYRYINGRNNDGLIFFKPQLDDPLLPYARRSNHAIVLLNAVDEEGILSSVTEDWQAGMRDVANSLLALGHRRIAALTGVNDAGDSHDRVRHLKACLNEAGVDIPAQWIISVDPKLPCSCNSALRFLMDDPHPPTALFCWHDSLGYRVLEECDLIGISVPEQLSIVGFDGLRWPAKTKHTLASVCVDLDAMGEAAVDILTRLIEREVQAPIQQVLSVKFEPGTTLAPVG